MVNPVRAARNRARSIRGTMRAAMVRGWSKAKSSWNDPPVDLVIAGVFGSTVGRAYLYASFIVTTLFSGMIAIAAVVAMVATFDLGLHAMTCKSLIQWLRHQYTGSDVVAPVPTPRFRASDGSSYVAVGDFS